MFHTCETDVENLIGRLEFNPLTSYMVEFFKSNYMTLTEDK